MTALLQHVHVAPACRRLTEASSSKKLRVVSFSSQAGEEHSALRAIDDDMSTWWQTDGDEPGPTNPHFIELEAAEGATIPRLSYFKYNGGNWSPRKLRILRRTEHDSEGRRVRTIRLAYDDSSRPGGQWVEILSPEEAGHDTSRVRLEVIKNVAGGIDSKVTAIVAASPEKAALYVATAVSGTAALDAASESESDSED